MSVSSYSSASSGSSSNGSSSSSSSTSSEASFSSCSTIVAPQSCIRPFGCPDYNYFWIENKSKSNPKLSYFYNYKSHCVVWQRPVPKDVPLPFYTHTWASRQTNLSEDEEDVIVSDNENDYCKKKRLELKKRNRRLADEEKDKSIQVLSIKKAIKSKRMLNTLWKLFRYPGESVQEVKKRLVDPSINEVKVKTEIPNDDEYGSKDYADVPIKNEPYFHDDAYALKIEEANKTIKIPDEDSDSDPENVSYIIKQEYMNMDNYVDSELENESKDEEEIPEEIAKVSENEEDFNLNSEDSEEESDEESVIFNCERTNAPMIKEEENEFEYTYEAPYLFASLFDIEITEDDKENIFIPTDDIGCNSSGEDKINWTFEKSADTANNSALTHMALNPFYKTPKLKKISSKHLKGNKKKRKQQKKKIPKLIIKREPDIEVKQEKVDNDDKPIICNMYGVRTVNYNNPSKAKVPKWQSCTKLSDSSGEDSEFEIENNRKAITNKVEISSKLQEKDKTQAPLELKNWFPKRKINKRGKSAKKSDSSWCELNFSDYSDLDEFDITLVKMKKEETYNSQEKEVVKIKQERCSSSEEEIVKPKEEKMDTDSEEQSQYTYTISHDNILVASFKRAREKGRLPVPRLEESKMMMSMTSPKAVADLSIVKVERRSSNMGEDARIAVNLKENGDDSNSSDSSSSSCTCSRSSCSCSSSSSSSASDDDGNHDTKVKQEDL